MNARARTCPLSELPTPLGGSEGRAACLFAAPRTAFCTNPAAYCPRHSCRPRNSAVQCIQLSPEKTRALRVCKPFCRLMHCLHPATTCQTLHGSPGRPVCPSCCTLRNSSRAFSPVRTVSPEPPPDGICLVWSPYCATSPSTCLPLSRLVWVRSIGNGTAQRPQAESAHATHPMPSRSQTATPISRSAAGSSDRVTPTFSFPTPSQSESAPRTVRAFRLCSS
ncbi:hypothetical protein C8Q80DRAFT_641919 [Daedaleopsis nitida]|nr:hypothetical protein C8Q80DRAFT_641919 [Daedaleopsis nitida]